MRGTVSTTTATAQRHTTRTGTPQRHESDNKYYNGNTAKRYFQLPPNVYSHIHVGRRWGARYASEVKST